MLGRICRMSGIFRSSAGSVRNLVATSGSHKICRNHSPSRATKDGPLTEEELLASYTWPKPKDHPLDIIFAREKSPDHPSKTYKEGSMVHTRSLNDVDGKRGQGWLPERNYKGAFPRTFSRSYSTNAHDGKAGRGRRGHKPVVKKSDTKIQKKRRDSSRTTDGPPKVKHRGRGKVTGTTLTSPAAAVQSASDLHISKLSSAVREMDQRRRRDVSTPASARAGVGGGGQDVLKAQSHTAVVHSWPAQCSQYLEEFMACVSRHCDRMRNRQGETSSSSPEEPSMMGLQAHFERSYEPCHPNY